MKSQLHLFLGVLFLVLTACSSDDSVPNNDLAGQNGFQFANQVFLTDNVYISDDNVVVLSNHFIDAEATVDDINIARFEITEEAFNEQSYFVGDKLISCFSATEARWNQGTINNGQVILEEDGVTSGFFRIVEIDRSIQQVRLIFEFERTDGQLVAGSYEGSYEATSF